MANRILWDAVFTDEGDVLDGGLDSLADGARTAAGAEYDNSADLFQYGKLELIVDFVSAPDAGAYCLVHMITAPDGTNYCDGSASVDPGDHKIVAVIPILASTAAQRASSNIFRLEPAKTKFLLTNETGQAFPASGALVALFTTADEVQ